jgi:putative nucleotidyltransferase with HDIG domain
MKQAFTSLSRPAAIFVAGVIGLGAAVLAHSVWHLLSHPIDARWILLAILTVGTGWVMLRIPSMEISFSISDTFNIAAAVLFGPAAGAVTAALDGLGLSYHFDRSQRTTHRILFNMAAPAVAIWVAAQVFFGLAGGRPLLDGPLAVLRLTALLAAFGTVNYLVSTGLVALAVSLDRRLPPLSIWRTHFLGLWVTHVGGVLAVIPLLMLQRIQSSISIPEMLILIAPLPIILYTTFRHAVGRVQDQIGHLGQVNRVYVAVIEALAHAIDAKDQVTHDHIRRVRTESVRLARALGITADDQLQAIMAAALLHDVGKIAVPEHILNKPGRLTPSEFEVMKRHAAAGADILSVVGFPYPVVPIVRHHHESWDGTGYPDGLAGEQIPVGARILSVVDCFDALTSHRPYRPRMADSDALQVILDRRGTMYDPRVVDAFVELCRAESTEALSNEPMVFPQPGTTTSPPPAPLDRELADLRAFCDLGRALASTASTEQIAVRLWSHLKGRLPASAFVLYSYVEERDALIAAHVAGEDAGPLLGSEVRLGDRLSGWVAAARQPIINSDARLDLPEGQRGSSALRSALAVPVETGRGLIAVLTFYSRDPNAFSDAHHRLAHAAAHAAAQSARHFSRPAGLPARLETAH